MKRRWSIADLLDLEYFLHADEQLRKQDGEAALVKRDRVIYLAKIAPKLGPEAPQPKDLAAQWLEVRRRSRLQEGESNAAILPGPLWKELTLVSRWLALAFGLISGLGLAASFFVYSGQRPLNVSSFIGVFILMQLLFLLIQAVLFLVRSLQHSGLESSVLYALVQRLFGRGMDWLHNKAQQNLGAEKRLQFAALLGKLRQRRELRQMFIWPIFIIIQLAAIGFNLGALALLCIRVVFSDIAFGWQSSLHFSAAQVAELVRLIALPWAWAFPNGGGYPSLTQVEGSQIILKDGIHHLATSDMVSWWPFLCLALLVYGLLPRLGLLLLGLSKQAQWLERLEFASPELRRLLDRMIMLRVETKGLAVSSQRPGPSEPPQAQLTPVAQAPIAASAPAQSLPAGLTQTLTLVPEELHQALPLSELEQRLGQWPGLGELRILPLPFSQEGEEAVLAQVAELAAAGRLVALMLVQEAWQPPLQETFSWISQLRRAAGQRIAITIALLGKVSPDGRLGQVSALHEQIWSQKMQALGDPFVETRILAEVEHEPATNS